jgi:hypothetical protein
MRLLTLDISIQRIVRLDRRRDIRSGAGPGFGYLVGSP